MDTSVPVEDPRKPREIEFGIECAGPLDEVYMTEGTYAQRARQGLPFLVDRKRHVLCITGVRTSGGFYQGSSEYAINYGGICAIASKYETASYIPWDLWKHEATPIDQYLEFAALKFVGPRMLVVCKKPHQGPSLHSFDFTPGACRFTEQIDTPFGDAPRYAIRRAPLTDTFPGDVFPGGQTVKWNLSDDNVLAFIVS